jgi:transketolase
MAAGHYQLSSLCALLDYNKMQSDNLNRNIMGLEPLNARWTAFGWNVIEIDGHDFDRIIPALRSAMQSKSQPTLIIAHTLKGKGVGFMQGVPSWHGSVKLKRGEFEGALLDLGVEESRHDEYCYHN